MSDVDWLVVSEEPKYRLGALVVGDRTILVQELSTDFLRYALPHVRRLAKVEGAPSHAKAVEVRLGNY